MSAQIQSSCPFCKIGFPVMFIKDDAEIQHLDLIWSSESGLSVPCKDKEAAKNLTKETLVQLNKSFHDDPSPFSKQTITEWEDFAICIGEFFRYAEWDKDFKEGITYSEIKAMYDSGLNMLEILHKVSL